MISLTTFMSALPLSTGVSSFMILPISFIDEGFNLSNTLSISAVISSVVNCLGKYLLNNAISRSRLSTESCLFPFLNSSILSLCVLTCLLTTSITISSLDISQ